MWIEYVALDGPAIDMDWSGSAKVIAMEGGSGVCVYVANEFYCVFRVS